MMAVDNLLNADGLWLAVGFAGQLLFSMRFVVQWVASEKRGESILPVAFWYFSICGGLLLLTYSLWRLDPVFILGQSMGLFIYGRNLHLIRRPATREPITV
jgi:lipid-A-disaccharide synthase-like uncharacterized protein